MILLTFFLDLEEIRLGFVISTQPTRAAIALEMPASEPELKEAPVQEAQVEIVGKDIPELKQAGVSLSDDQRQELEKLGVNPQAVENAVGQDVQGKIPIIVVLNREVERKVTKSTPEGVTTIGKPLIPQSF
jgi:hypothetical protein